MVSKPTPDICFNDVTKDGRLVCYPIAHAPAELEGTDSWLAAVPLFSVLFTRCLKNLK